MHWDTAYKKLNFFNFGNCKVNPRIWNTSLIKIRKDGCHDQEVKGNSDWEPRPKDVGSILDSKKNQQGILSQGNSDLKWLLQRWFIMSKFILLVYTAQDYPSQPKRGRSLVILYRDLFKNAWLTSHFLPSVTSLSSNTRKVRGLIIGMHNPYMNGSKVTDQIFDVLPRSWDI